MTLQQYDFIFSWHIIDLILYDFFMAFDMVIHPILLEKLQCIGICCQLLQWIQKFLVGHTYK